MSERLEKAKSFGWFLLTVSGLIVWFFLLVLPAISSCDNNTCYVNLYEDITFYEFNPSTHTLSGIAVDLSEVPGVEVDLPTLDERIKRIEECLIAVGATLPTNDSQNMYNWGCLRDPSEVAHIRRDCLKIKVVPAARSTCSSWEFLPVKAPSELCKAKGLVETPECPCRWRSAIQHDTILVTPPALYLWDIGRIVTGCNNIWGSPFSKCLSY